MADAAAQLREYVRLDRKQRGGGLSTAEPERWMLLKRALGKRFTPEPSDAQADQRALVRRALRHGSEP